MLSVQAVPFSPHKDSRAPIDASGSASWASNDAALPMSGIELMKTFNVRGVEKTRVRRMLLRRAIGCTAAEKEN